MRPIGSIVLSTALLTCSLGASVGADDGVGQVSLFQSVDDNGRVTSYDVPESRLLGSPKWSPTESDPPLAVPVAVTTAVNHVKPAHPSDLVVTSVSLSAVGTADEFRWYYVVSMYDSSAATSREPPPIHDVVVLFDGEVIEPAAANR